MRTTILFKTIATFFCLASTCHAQWDGYKAIVDFANVQNDRARVTVNLPRLTMDTAIVVFPETIPGTYDKLQYWQRIQNFNPVDSNGLTMPFFRTSDGQFAIPNARACSFLVYDVDDTFDETDTTKPFVFHPAGTSIAAGESFVINAAGFFPYVDGVQKKKYGIMVKKPAELLGSSSLEIIRLNDTLDSFQARDYDELVDNPVLYAHPDTASFVVAGTTVTIACAHPSIRGIASRIAPNVRKICETVGRFLPAMPVDRYTFLIYAWSPADKSVYLKVPAFGALEHSTSSFYFMPEQGIEQTIVDVAAHEFLHILVPLNVHSEEIDEFNFRTPKMSQHLWLYEGATEYFASLAQVRDAMISVGDFLQSMRSKVSAIRTMEKGFSFTDFSKNVLSPNNNAKYPLVYTYGAANAWLLDIIISSETKGQKDLLRVVYDLMEKFGPNRPFKDDALFSEIERLTTAGTAAYLRQHVSGTAPIPMKDILSRIGILYEAERKVEGITYGFRFSFEVRNGSPGLYLDPDGDNSMKVEKDDKVVQINGRTLQEVDRNTFEALRNPKEDQRLTLIIERKGRQVTLEGVAKRGLIPEYDFLAIDDSASAEAKRLRSFVLGNKQ